MSAIVSSVCMFRRIRI